MLIVSPVRADRRLAAPAERDGDARWGIEALNIPRSDIPAVTHLDYTARVQTVTREQSPGLREVLEAFESRTGCPVLVNTSFNVRGEPIVCTPADAYTCLMRTHIDLLAIPPFLVRRSAQPSLDDPRWQRPAILD